MGYLTVSELRANPISNTGLNQEQENSVVLSDIHDLTDNQIQMLIDYCTVIINTYTGVDFNSYPDETRFFSGDGWDVLYIDRCYNVKEVTNIKDPRKKLNFRISSSLTKLFSDGYFEEGEENYKVLGDWGYLEVPKDVKLCMYILINQNYSNLFDEDKVKNSASPFKSEKIANYQYTKEDKSEFITSTGNSTVDQILQQFRIDDINVGVI